MLHWHRDPGSKRYHSRETAQRAVWWLNAQAGVWRYRVGPFDGGRVVLERRWVGEWDGLIGD